MKTVQVPELGKGRNKMSHTYRGGRKALTVKGQLADKCRRNDGVRD